ncbi:MAG: hypothetical protein HZB53_14290 [Chloroflexi bacterium]|nr:hypothetical protein [Chloroflexota bacterium]
MAPRNSLPPAPPRSGLTSNRLLLIGLPLLLLCACCFCAVIAVGAWAVSNGTIDNLLNPSPDAPNIPLGSLSRDQGKAATAAAAFVQKVQAGSWADAYALCTPALQRQVGSATALGQAISAAKGQPNGPLKVDGVSTVSAGTTSATVTGTALFGKTPGPVLVELERIGADWKVNGFSLNK